MAEFRSRHNLITLHFTTFGAPGMRRVTPNVHLVHVSHRFPNIMEADAYMRLMAHISGSCRASRAYVEYFVFLRHVAMKVMGMSSARMNKKIRGFLIPG